MKASALLVLASLLGVGVLGYDHSTLPEPADDAPVVDGHPGKVTRPVVGTRLPDRPGPMAGVMEHDGGWSVLDSAGRSWRIDDLSRVDSYPPALSDDGRMLGYLREVDAERSEYVIVDLVTGERIDFGMLGDSAGVLDSTVQPYWVTPQAPGYWSPDNRWLTANGTRTEGSVNTGPLLLGTTGEVRELDVPGWVVGWEGPDRLLMLDPAGASVSVVDLTGRELRRSELDSPGPWQLSQWSGRASADGSRLAVHDSENGLIRIFDVATGAELDWSVADSADSCGLGWRDGQVVGWAGNAVRDAASLDAVVEFSTEWGSVLCVIFTPDALGGPERSPGLFEWRYWQWLWWWWQILVGLASVAVVLTIRWLLCLDRRRVG